jgi:eukaryotic-like serine/threonine-protein kinase
MSNEPHEAQPRESFFRRPSGRLVLRVLGISLVAFLIGFALTAVFLFRGGPGDEVVTVPDLRLRGEAEARSVAARFNLALDVAPALSNPEVPEGHVLAQSPLPGEEVAPGTAVRVTLSAGPERYAVPEVGGMRVDQARQQLERFGFGVAVEERTDPAPEGRVLEVTPPPGTMVAFPATVELVVSAGPPRVPVPYVIGMSDAEARNALREVGFRVLEIDYHPLTMEPAGTVLQQQPAAGVEAQIGSGVRLTVAGTEPWNL